MAECFCCIASSSNYLCADSWARECVSPRATIPTPFPRCCWRFCTPPFLGAVGWTRPISCAGMVFSRLSRGCQLIPIPSLCGGSCVGWRFADWGKLHRVHDSMLMQLWQRPKPPRRVIFDMDSTVLTLYGHQEQALIGYNPRKHGRPSYHPWVCFEAQTRDFWHGELRPGNVHTGHGTAELLAACFAQIPPPVRQIRVRADAGFFDRKVIAALEARRGKFVIVAKLTRPFKLLLPGLTYTEVRPGLEVPECSYPPHGCSRPYRFVVARKSLSEEETTQTKLFPLVVTPITLSSPTFVFDLTGSI